MTVTNGYMEYRPSLAMRFWKRLGFRYSAHCGRPEDDEAHYTVHRIFAHWDWRDRIRIMISGNTETEICIETETLENIKGVRQQAVVLAPGTRFPSGVRKT